jgi:hypothetical protein
MAAVKVDYEIMKGVMAHAESMEAALKELSAQENTMLETGDAVGSARFKKTATDTAGSAVELKEAFASIMELLNQLYSIGKKFDEGVN